MHVSGGHIQAWAEKGKLMKMNGTTQGWRRWGPVWELSGGGDHGKERGYKSKMRIGFNNPEGIGDHGTCAKW